MSTYSSDLIVHLSQFVTENRLKLINRVLDKRTRYLTLVLEDIFQPQNASAVLRSCDCFGLQDVHIIENRNVYKVNRDVALGSHQWLDLHFYNENAFNTDTAIESLRARGYRIVATSPSKEHVPIKAFDVSKGRSAFLFGTELEGLTDRAIDLADEFVHIPMYGFTESFNISVAAAITLYELRSRLDRSGAAWQLSDEEKAELKLKWLRNSIKKPRLIEKDFKSKYKS